jgi:hypothetical protein
MGGPKRVGGLEAPLTSRGAELRTIRELFYAATEKPGAAHGADLRGGQALAGLIARHYLDAMEAVPDDPDASQIRGQAVTTLIRGAER